MERTVTGRWGQSVAIATGMLLALFVAGGAEAALRIVGAIGALFLPLALWSVWTRRPVLEDRWDLLALSPVWAPLLVGVAARVWHLPLAVGFGVALAITAPAVALYVLRQLRRRRSSNKI
jgi:hypothetical protein